LTRLESVGTGIAKIRILKGLYLSSVWGRHTESRRPSMSEPIRPIRPLIRRKVFLKIYQDMEMGGPSFLKLQEPQIGSRVAFSPQTHSKCVLE
jgi:hypothetical protein